MLGYRLYDIDLVIDRTLVYGLLMASLVLVYAGGVVGLQFTLRGLTGQETQLAVVVSTLAIAALLNPLRRRIQSFVDRSIYRSKYDAQKALEEFGATLRDATDLGGPTGKLTGVVRETVQPAHVPFWLAPARGKGVDD